MPRSIAWACGSLLAQLGQEGTRLAAIQWLERTIRDSGRGLDEWWRKKGHPDAGQGLSQQVGLGGSDPGCGPHSGLPWRSGSAAPDTRGGAAVVRSVPNAADVVTEHCTGHD
jgi:hypothetical protein